MATEKEDPPPIGWLRAIATAAAIVLVGFGLLVFGANTILTKVHGTTRGNLVGIVTPLFFGVLVAMAVGLRWLQRRKVI